MRYGDRTLPGAHLDTLAAFFVLRELGVGRLNQVVQGLLASPDPWTREAGRQLRESAFEMVEARRRWMQRDGEARAGSGSGTSEPVFEGVVTDSSRLLGGVPGLSVQVVATRLRVSCRRVRKLCFDGVLVATKPGSRAWVIDAESVAAYELARSRVA